MEKFYKAFVKGRVLSKEDFEELKKHLTKKKYEDLLKLVNPEYLEHIGIEKE